MLLSSRHVYFAGTLLSGFENHRKLFFDGSVTQIRDAILPGAILEHFKGGFPGWYLYVLSITHVVVICLRLGTPLSLSVRHTYFAFIVQEYTGPRVIRHSCASLGK